MFEQVRETLPVALSELRRQKETHEQILQSIMNNLGDPVGLFKENENELLEHNKIVHRHIGELTARITRLQNTA
jgi:hypothetical protein